VLCYIDEEENAALGIKRGWTEWISTRADWRRKGVASHLICRGMRALKARGMEEAALGVHTENPDGAFRLYESLGYRVVKLYTTYRKPLS
jgi:ribosomal protein S18 acetylase RimI-like enzyme